MEDQSLSAHLADTTIRPELLSYDDFVKDTLITSRITAINQFTYTVKYQTNAQLTNPSITDAVLSACLESLSSILPATGIEYLHRLKTNTQRASADQLRLDPEKSIASVSMPETPNHFSLSVYDDRIVIHRDRSSFADFYQWYRRLMPEAEGDRVNT